LHHRFEYGVGASVVATLGMQLETSQGGSAQIIGDPVNPLAVPARVGMNGAPGPRFAPGGTGGAAGADASTNRGGSGGGGGGGGPLGFATSPGGNGGAGGFGHATAPDQGHDGSNGLLGGGGGGGGGGGSTAAGSGAQEWGGAGGNGGPGYVIVCWSEDT
jgi:hypothetical protein